MHWMASGPQILKLDWSSVPLHVFLRQPPRESSIFVQDLVRALTDWSPAAANGFVDEHRAQLQSEGRSFLEHHGVSPVLSLIHI